MQENVLKCTETMSQLCNGLVAMHIALEISKVANDIWYSKHYVIYVICILWKLSLEWHLSCTCFIATKESVITLKLKREYCYENRKVDRSGHVIHYYIY